MHFPFIDRTAKRRPDALERLRRSLLIAAMGVGGLTGSASTAHAQLYPQCIVPNCGLSYNHGPVLGGQVQIYTIWYGNASPVTQGIVAQFLQNLPGSVYEATETTYGSTSNIPVTLLAPGSLENFPDAAYSEGTSLNDGSIQNELKLAINNHIFSSDSNGIYIVMLPGNVSAQDQNGVPYCSCNSSGQPVICGYHNSFVLNNTDIKYAVTGDFGNTPNCGCCTWQGNGIGRTPNGATDGVLSTLAHEINEALTDPDVENGWYDFSALPGPPTEMADFCSWETGTTYTAFLPECLGGSTNCSATANVELNGLDYMLQPLRANSSGGGYCALYYGGPFWGQNWGYQWSPIGDWSIGSYKGECQTEEPLIGLSKFPGQQAHAVLCANSNPTNIGSQSASCYTRRFGAAILGGNDGDPSDGNWDPDAQYLGACQENEFVAGVSQSAPGDANGQGRVNALLCCPASSNLRGSCTRQVFDGQNSPGFHGSDWDYGYYKGECPSGAFVAGVSTLANGAPRSLLCCNPGG